MYLYASKYVSNTRYSNPNQYAEIIKAIGAEEFPKSIYGSAIVDIEIGYWRKANAIHGWFINDREDGCEAIYVPRHNLKELRDTCRMLTLTKDENLAKKSLPPTSGFFFGDTDITEYYWEYVKDTAEMLENILVNIPDNWDFKYQASW